MVEAGEWSERVFNVTLERERLPISHQPSHHSRSHPTVFSPVILSGASLLRRPQKIPYRAAQLIPSLSASNTQASVKMHFALPAFVSLALASTSYAAVWNKALEVTGAGYYDNFVFETIVDPTHGRV